MQRRYPLFHLLSILAISLCTLFATTSHATQLSFDLRLSENEILLSNEGGRQSVLVAARGFQELQEPGRPSLPVRVISILLPQGELVEDFRFEVIEERILRRDVSLPIAAPPVSEDGKQGNPAPLFHSASVGDPFPPVAVEYLGSGYLHGFAIASFAVCHLQYRRGSLVLNGRIRLYVTTTSGDLVDVARRVRYRKGFEENVKRTVRSLVINPEDVETYQMDFVRKKPRRGGFAPTMAPSLEGSPVDNLIITSEALASEYQRLADWKTSKGVPTVVRTIEWIEQNCKHGVDLQETLRFFIRDAYNKWGVTWVLLGGDTDVIPARYALSRFFDSDGTLIPTDMYFACLDGSWNDTHDKYWGEGNFGGPLDNPDLYAEVYVGRLTTSNVTDVSCMIDKIISYETPVNPDNAVKVELLAEVLFPVDWEPGDPINMDGADLSQYLYILAFQGKPLNVVRSYQTWESYPGAIPESRQATIDSMNAGINVVNHIGHGFRFNLSVGDASVVNSDADALHNTDRYFLLYMLNCTAAAYDYYCLAEHFLRNCSGGAVSIVGANRSAYPNASSLYMNDFYHLMFNRDVVHLGEAFARSRLNRTPTAEASDNVDLWTHYIYTLLSDPEIPIWTGPVGTLDVAHPANVGLGQNTIAVNVSSGGQPVDSAVVCLYKGTEDYQYEATDASGSVSFDFTCETPGSVNVVVTGMNFARHESYIVVDSSVDPYVSFASLTVDDDSTGSSYGNGDGIIDAGETVDLTLALVNTGGASSDSVWCILRSSAPYVTVEDSLAGFGPFSVGETKQALDPVRVHFESTLPDEAAVQFSLEVNTSSLTWTDTFRKVVHAPLPELLSLRIDDNPPLGNGNGTIEPGEEFKLYYKIKNYGSGRASGLQAAIEDLDDAFTFFDSTDSYPDIARVSTAENISGFHLAESATDVEHYIQVTLTDLFGRTIIDSIELRPPTPPTDLTFDASKGEDRIEVSWANSASADVSRYNVYHSLTQGGPYQLGSIDPCEHAVFVDTGLQPSTKYYFVVTAIDSSGNESANSAEGSASTNPPQLEGWPITMADWTASSPVVGDIDGDGDLEIVQGDKYVYAWHHNGFELRDGDADPQTWGILNTYGLDFVAPVALTHLDANPGLDIVAVSYTTREVYCFDYQGNVLAGWPRSTETNARAAPVIADLDGDGDGEIVVVDQAGVVYVWHHNGTEYRDGDSNPATDGVFFRIPSVSGWHYQAPAVCDMDNDSRDELVVGSLMDSIYVFNGDGTNVPGWPVGISGELAGSIAVGDADLDGYFEILVACKISSEVKLLNHDGTLCPGWPRSIASNITFNPSPALADVYGDDHLEIIMASSNRNIYIIDYQGSDVPGWPRAYSSTAYTECSPVVADITGDRSPDIILGDESKFIHAWEVNGNPVDGFPIAVEDAVRGTPVVCDLDYDGDAELVVAGWDRNLYVWDLAGAFLQQDAPWPMFHANIHRNGQAGANIPTGLGEVTFRYRALGEALELSWTFAPGAGGVFDLYKAEYRSEAFPSFELVASGMVPDRAGNLSYMDRDIEPAGTYAYRLIDEYQGRPILETGKIRVPIAEPDLLQNYPNPFNPRTTIEFLVPEGAPQMVSLKVYDVRGALVRTLMSSVLKPDRYRVAWDGTNDEGEQVGSGVYFYRLVERGYVATRKMVLLK